MTPFRYKAVNGDTVPEGIVCSISLPSENPIQYLWCFHERATYTALFAQGYEAWIRFYLGQQLVTELPACLVPSTAGRIGVAGYQLALNTQNNTGVSGANVMWWNTNSSNVQNPIHPFPLRVKADLVRLEHNSSYAVTSFLGVMSMP